MYQTPTMEGPLYGETTKQQKTLLYVMAIALGILTIAAVLGCVIVAFMDKNYSHFILVIALVALTVAIALFVCYHCLLLSFLFLPLINHVCSHLFHTDSGSGISRSTSTPSSSGCSAFFLASLLLLTLPASSTLLSTRSPSPSPSPSGLLPLFYSRVHSSLFHAFHCTFSPATVSTT